MLETEVSWWQLGLLLGEGDAKCVVHDCVPGSPAFLSDKIKKGDLIVKARVMHLT